MKNLLINLSFYNSNESGLEVLSKNILPFLRKFNPILLSPHNHEDYNVFNTSPDLSSANGRKGFLKRLLWTQFEVPKLYKYFNTKLLFSPLNEAPINDKIKSVITIADSIPLRFGSSFKVSPLYHKYIMPLVAQNAVNVICISKSTAEDAKRYYNVKEKNLTVALLGYDESHFIPHSKIHDKKYFLFLGRTDLNKNHFRIIDAFNNLKISDPIELWFVGKKDVVYFPLIQKYANSTSAGDRIKFLDYLSYQDLPKVISNALALVFPSLWEGFGLPVLEAMACATPVITSNLSSLPEVAGDAAILVNPYNTLEISNAMQRILDNPLLSENLIRLGLVQSKKFSWEKTGEIISSVIEKHLN